MTRALPFLGLWVLAACASCGGTVGDPPPAGASTSSTDGGATSAATASSAPKDAGSASAAGDASLAACASPADCTASAPLCCARLETGPGSPPACSVKTMVKACAAACPTELNTKCETTEVLRLCAASTDCTEPGYPSCCRFKQGGTELTFCGPKAMEGLAEKCF